MTSNDGAVRPQIEQSVDVAVERIRFRGNIQYVMHQHVRLQRTHEQQRCCTRVASPDHSGLHRPAEIVGDDRQPSSRWTVGVIGIERHHQRARSVVHVDGDVFGDDFFGEGDEFFGDPAQNYTRILPGIDVCELEDEIRGSDDPSMHRELEELEL